MQTTAVPGRRSPRANPAVVLASESDEAQFKAKGSKV